MSRSQPSPGEGANANETGRREARTSRRSPCRLPGAGAPFRKGRVSGATPEDGSAANAAGTTPQEWEVAGSNPAGPISWDRSSAVERQKRLCILVAALCGGGSTAESRVASSRIRVRFPAIAPVECRRDSLVIAKARAASKTAALRRERLVSSPLSTSSRAANAVRTTPTMYGGAFGHRCLHIPRRRLLAERSRGSSLGS